MPSVTGVLVVLSSTTVMVLFVSFAVVKLTVASPEAVPVGVKKAVLSHVTVAVFLVDVPPVVQV